MLENLLALKPVILEAFSTHLKAANQPLTPELASYALAATQRKPNPASQQPSRAILHRWLMSHLQAAEVDNHVTSVIQAELMLVVYQAQTFVAPVSPSGQRLLTTLEEYCDSYDQWQFSRWLHVINASDFEPFHP